MNPMTQEQQIRFNLVMNLTEKAQYNELDFEKMYTWIMGEKKSILPVQSFKVVKPDGSVGS